MLKLVNWWPKYKWMGFFKFCRWGGYVTITIDWSILIGCFELRHYRKVPLKPEDYEWPYEENEDAEEE